ncbi:MAG: HmuY family protein [Bacteroidota bacterium]
MILRARYFLLALTVTLLASCFKEDEPVVLSAPGEVQMSQVAMGPDYANQIYYKLSNKAEQLSDHHCWDLAFETSPSGFHIWLNGGHLVFAANTNSSNFNGITDTLGAQWKWDASSWNKDSTAIGVWVNSNPDNPTPTKQGANTASPGKIEQSELATGVYLIDLGNDLPYSDRFKKAVFESVNNYEYTFKYANLDNSDLHTVTVQKESGFAYTYFSIRSGGVVVHPEPVKSEWDILFTRYHYVFYQAGNTIHYVVTGVLINPTGYSVAVDSSKTFADVDYNFAKNLNYTTRRDAIGFDWKHINYQTSATYTVDENKIYLLKDNTGYYWKLHFIGFYNDQGIKGYPQFEYQRL